MSVFHWRNALPRHKWENVLCQKVTETCVSFLSALLSTTQFQDCVKSFSQHEESQKQKMVTERSGPVLNSIPDFCST